MSLRSLSRASVSDSRYHDSTTPDWNTAWRIPPVFPVFPASAAVQTLATSSTDTRVLGMTDLSAYPPAGSESLSVPASHNSQGSRPIASIFFSQVALAYLRFALRFDE